MTSGRSGQLAPIAADAAPTSPAERVEAIDIVRGLALFGVLVVNLLIAFRVPIFQSYLPSRPPLEGVGRAVDLFMRYVLQGKALTLFAFLFGAGLAIQWERLAARGEGPYRLFRRLAVLLAFGLAHLLLVWSGDILTVYALLGFVATPLMAAAPARLLRWAAMLFGISILLSLMPWPAVPDARVFALENATASHVYANGSYRDIRAYSLHELAVTQPMLLYLHPQTLGLFLLGAWAWRKGLLRDPSRHRGLLHGIAIVGIVAGAILTHLNNSEAWTPSTALGAVLLFPSFSFAPVVLAMGYAAVLLLALEHAGARRVLAAFGPVGRMAFSNYIAQSLVFTTVFFGYGLGLMGRVGPAAALAFGIAVYALQVAWSAAWLRRHRFGPLEWLWRTLTYGRIPRP